MNGFWAITICLAVWALTRVLRWVLESDGFFAPEVKPEVKVPPIKPTGRVWDEEERLLSLGRPELMDTDTLIKWIDQQLGPTLVKDHGNFKTWRLSPGRLMDGGPWE